jgi:hypothetical protein
MIWLILIIAFITQEFASTGATMLAALAQHIDPWFIHLMWLLGTLGDTALGFFIGKGVQKKFYDSKADLWAQKWAKKIDHAAGNIGIKASLVFMGLVSYPYLVAFAASWLPKIHLRDIFIYVLIGNFFWYLFEWATVLGIAAAGRNYQLIFAIIAAAGVTLILVSNALRKKLQIEF